MSTEKAVRSLHAFLFALLATALLGGTGLAAPPSDAPARAAAAVPPATPVPSVSASPATPDEDAKPAETEEAAPAEAREGHHGHHDGKGDVRFGQGFTVAKGEAHEGDIVVFGGPVEVAGSQSGGVVVFGGPARVSGQVSGDLVVFGGSAYLSPTAHVSGDVVLLGGGLQKETGATIGGQSVQLPGGKVVAGLIPAGLISLGGIGLGLSILAWLKTAVLALLLAVVIAAVLPAHVEAAASVLRARPLPCLGVGFVAFVAAFPLTLLLCVTCVGAVVPFIFYQVAKYFGLTVLFLVVGQALGRAAFKRDLTAIPGVLVGFLALSLIGLLAPAWFVYAWIGVGCALLTRFGTMRPWLKKKGPAPDSDIPSSPAPEAL